MSNLTGAVSGTKVILGIGTGLGIGVSTAPYDPLPGEVSHSISDTVELIDITNKSLADFRCYLEGEGRRILDLTVEVIHNDDAILQRLFDAFDQKLSVSIRRTIGTRIITSNYMVASNSDSPGLNTAVNDSFTLNSTGTIVVT